MNPPKKTIITGTFALQSEEFGRFSEQQILLLQAIHTTGSITKAAKEVGISYKTAWDRIEGMNNLSIQPLVKRSAGGAKGGGTALTDAAEQFITQFIQLQHEHNQLLQQMGGELDAKHAAKSRSPSPTLSSSARNQLRGRVASIVEGKIDSEISIDLGNSVEIVAVVTNTSRLEMGLEVGYFVIALIKSSWILLSKHLELKTSARNNLEGEIVRLIKGDVNSEVIIDIGNEKTLCCIITNTSAKELELQAKDAVIFKASSVILLAD
jgi:molybdate transport system regulatory protein